MLPSIALAKDFMMKQALGAKSSLVWGMLGFEMS